MTKNPPEELGEAPENANDVTAEGLSDAEPTVSPAPDGDMICLKRMPGRMVVCRKPLEPERELADGEASTNYEEIDVDTIEQGLKAILHIARQNPVDDSEDAHLAAGYGEKPSPMNMNAGAGY